MGKKAKATVAGKVFTVESICVSFRDGDPTAASTTSALGRLANWVLDRRNGLRLLKQ